MVGSGTNYPITASVGAFTLTGIATALSAGMSLVASAGAFTLTGIAVVFDSGKGMVATVGTFILTGLDATLQPSRTLRNITKNVASVINRSKS